MVQAADRRIVTDARLGGAGGTGVARADGIGVVVHGANAATPRPTGYAAIRWIGTVAPANALATRDDWLDIS
jgi:hypothetical protein